MVCVFYWPAMVHVACTIHPAPDSRPVLDCYSSPKMNSEEIKMNLWPIFHLKNQITGADSFGCNPNEGFVRLVSIFF